MFYLSFISKLILSNFIGCFKNIFKIVFTYVGIFLLLLTTLLYVGKHLKFEITIDEKSLGINKLN